MRRSRIVNVFKLCFICLKKLINLYYRRPRIAIFIVLVSLINFLVYAYASTIFYSTSIRSIGAVKALGVGVYWDENCSRPVTVITWGIIDPRSAKNVTIYIRNEGNVPVTIGLQTNNWEPASAASYMNLTWDYNNELINPDEKFRVTLTLTVSADIGNVTDFSFDIIISVVE